MSVGATAFFCYGSFPVALLITEVLALNLERKDAGGKRCQFLCSRFRLLGFRLALCGVGQYAACPAIYYNLLGLRVK